MYSWFRSMRTVSLVSIVINHLLTNLKAGQPETTTTTSAVITTVPKTAGAITTKETTTSTTTASTESEMTTKSTTTVTTTTVPAVTEGMLVQLFFGTFYLHYLLY